MIRHRTFMLLCISLTGCMNKTIHPMDHQLSVKFVPFPLVSDRSKEEFEASYRQVLQQNLGRIFHAYDNPQERERILQEYNASALCDFHHQIDLSFPRKKNSGTSTTSITTSI